MYRPSTITPILITTVFLGVIFTLQVNGSAELEKEGNATKAKIENLKTETLCTSDNKIKNRIEINLLNNSFTWIRCKANSI